MPVTIPGLPEAPQGARVNGGPSTVEFFDFFFADNLGAPDQDFGLFFQWTVTGGSVDLVGGTGLGVFGAPPGQEDGRFVDLGGSTGDPGLFETTLAYNVIAGQTYNLTFDYRSTEGDLNRATVTVGDRSWTVRTDSEEFLRFSRDFVADTTGPVRISFQGAEGDTDGSGIGIDGVLFGTVLDTGPNETLVASPNPNHLEGRGGDDVLIGAQFEDRLRGGSGADTLLGNAGDDRLFAGRGGDTLSGALGADRFIFAVADQRDTILDFSQAENDRIDLRRIDAMPRGDDDRFSFIGDDAFLGEGGEVRVVYRDGFASVRGDLDGDQVPDFLIRVQGVTEATPLTAGDFIL